MKACYSYLDSKEHLDIEENYNHVDREMNDVNWNTLINYYYQIVQ